MTNKPTSFLPIDFPEMRHSITRRNPRSERELTVLNALIAKKESQGGISEGFHGTSSSRALKIQSEGFTNYRCVEGEWGIHFHDDGYFGNARLHALDKAKDDGDNSYAIIRGRSNQPRPDLAGRPQFVAAAETIEIVSIEFYDLENNPLSAPVGVSGEASRQRKKLGEPPI